MNAEEDLKGLKGWLILIGLGLVLSPWRLALQMGPLFYNMFTDGTFEYLTTPGTESYHPLWKPILFFEMIYNGIMILSAFFLAFLFFKKHYLFPRAYIGFTILPVIVVPLDAWLGSLVVTNEAMFDPATLKELIGSLLGAIIWIPYMILSKRVKATFVEGKAEEVETKSE